MATPNTSFGEIASLTLQKLEGTLVDSVSNLNPFYAKIKEMGKVKNASGGLQIVQPIEFAANGNYSRISGYDEYPTTANETFTSINLSPKQIVSTVVASDLEIQQNAGDSQVFDLLESRIDNMRHSFENSFTIDLLSAGSASGGKQITGVQAFLPDTTGGTYGGVSGTTYSFWAHQVYDCSSSTIAANWSASNAVPHLNAALLTSAQYKGRTNLILLDDAYFPLFESAVQAMQRIGTEGGRVEVGGVGFTGYMYKNIPVVFHPVNSGMVASHAFLFDMNFVYLRPYKGRNMVLMPAKESFNQLATLRVMAWMGNLACSNRRVQVVIKN